MVTIKQGFTQTKTFSIVWDLVFADYSISLIVTKNDALIKTYLAWDMVMDNILKTIEVEFSSDITATIWIYKCYFVFADGSEKKISIPDTFFTINVVTDYIK